MTVYNPVIDMSSIRINDDGDFEFDITATETEDKSSSRYNGYLILPYKGNIENLASWYYHSVGIAKDVAKNVLDEIRELGREAWIEKYKKQIKTKDNLYNFDISHSDTMWQFTIYDDENG